MCPPYLSRAHYPTRGVLSNTVSGVEQGETVGSKAVMGHLPGFDYPVGQQGIPEATERDLFQIPRRLGKVYKAPLKASSADWACDPPENIHLFWERHAGTTPERRE
jgi:hypothetical protein